MEAFKHELYQELREIVTLFRRYVEQNPAASRQPPVARGLRREFRIQRTYLRGSKAALEELYQEVGECRKCGLWRSRTKPVFGAGSERAGLVFVGEAPGRDEDLQGQPFVGAAGKLLTRILESIGLKREEVYITNILKCRPPGNRNPSSEEIQTCRGYLARQLAIIKPRIICALGTFAAQTLLGTSEPISRLRGRFHACPVKDSLGLGHLDASDGAGGQDVKLMPTFHPAALLRNPSYKRLVWEDMKLLGEEYKKIKG